jgi:hypothetical protein
VHEGRPNVVDAMINREIQLVVNTPIGRESAIDDGYIRSTAMRHQVPCITTLTGAEAAVEAIAALREGTLEVRSLQELAAGTRQAAAARRQAAAATPEARRRLDRRRLLGQPRPRRLRCRAHLERPPQGARARLPQDDQQPHGDPRRDRGARVALGARARSPSTPTRSTW